MKKENGITLVSLVLYIVIFTATLGLLSALSNYIFGNLDNISTDSVSSEEFNKFNVNFVKDIKENSSAQVVSGANEVTIKFGSTSTVYTYNKSDKAIYKGKVKIATNILNFTANSTMSNGKNVISVSISTGKDSAKPSFSKDIKYVLKYWWNIRNIIPIKKGDKNASK